MAIQRKTQEDLKKMALTDLVEELSKAAFSQGSSATMAHGHSPDPQGDQDDSKAWGKYVVDIKTEILSRV